MGEQDGLGGPISKSRSSGRTRENRQARVIFPSASMITIAPEGAMTARQTPSRGRRWHGRRRATRRECTPVTRCFENRSRPSTIAIGASEGAVEAPPGVVVGDLGAISPKALWASQWADTVSSPLQGDTTRAGHGERRAREPIHGRIARRRRVRRGRPRPARLPRFRKPSGGSRPRGVRRAAHVVPGPRAARIRLLGAGRSFALRSGGRLRARSRRVACCHSRPRLGQAPGLCAPAQRHLLGAAPPRRERTTGHRSAAPRCSAPRER